MIRKDQIGIKIMGGDWAAQARIQLEGAESRIRLFKKNADPNFIEIYEKVRNITMLSFEKLYDLFGAVNYINRANIPGSIIEIGTWKGGAMAAAMLADLSKNRSFIGFDTFEGHLRPPKSEFDIRGNRLQDVWDREVGHGKRMAYSSFEECENNLIRFKETYQKLELVKGDVRNTLLAHLPNQIAILRIDCDWHSETLFTLKHLWDKIAFGGILYLDAFGHVSGMRQAYLDFFLHKNIKYSHIDYAGIVIQKR